MDEGKERDFNFIQQSIYLFEVLSPRGEEPLKNFIMSSPHVQSHGLAVLKEY